MTLCWSCQVLVSGMEGSTRHSDLLVEKLLRQQHNLLFQCRLFLSQPVKYLVAQLQLFIGHVQRQHLRLQLAYLVDQVSICLRQLAVQLLYHLASLLQLPHVLHIPC